MFFPARSLTLALILAASFTTALTPVLAFSTPPILLSTSTTVSTTKTVSSTKKAVPPPVHAVVSTTPVSTVTSPPSTTAPKSSLSIASSTSLLTTDFVVQADDLSHVGFTGVQRVLPVKGQFEEPIRYFRVQESLVGKDKDADCPDCANLAAVYVTRQMVTSTPVWVVRANPLILPMGGRLQLRWFAANRIIFVTAPGGEARVRALGAWLRERAILDKVK